MHEIANALKGKKLTAKEIESKIDLPKNALVRFSALTEKLYENDDRSRSLETIAKSVVKGSLAELAVGYLLRDAGFEVEFNDPDYSGEFSWDLKANGKKLEIKSQSGLRKGGNGERDFFSYSVTDDHEYKKIANFRQMWQQYDFLLAVKVYGTGVDSIYVPWIIVDHAAFNPNNNLFAHSKHYKDQWFLKMGVCVDKGFLIYI